jgi:hypothetical protein
MPKYMLMNKDGYYLGQTAFVPFAADARVFDAEEAAIELNRRKGECFAWQILSQTGDYSPERTQRLPAFRDTCMKAA